MKGWLGPFYSVSLILLRFLPEKWLKRRKPDLEQRLRRLYPGRSRVRVEDYYAKRISMTLAILLMGAGLVIVSDLAVGTGKEQGAVESLKRPGYGKGNGETELEVFVEGENQGIRIPVEVSERTYTHEETKEIFANIMEQMDTMILGENESLDAVQRKLNLMTSLEEDTIKVQWYVSPTDILDEEGNILRETRAEGEMVELRASLQYKSCEMEYICYARVFPPEKTKAERLLETLLSAVAKADQEGKYEEQMKLPKEVNGQSVDFYGTKENDSRILFLLVVVCAIAIFLKEKQKLEDLEKERKRQLIMDYPDLLFKLSMLLGAGLTIKMAFQKIALEYQRRTDRKLHYVYEEMLVTCRELENGVGEAAAYEAFGKRCGEGGYVKLGSLLSQNLKKGAKGLGELLEQEAAAGFEERKNQARKLGEEAGTKLLIPMMLMLVLVLVILMVPAVMNF